MFAVATHNILVSLSDEKAGEALGAVLDEKPDIVGLQEWGRNRRATLRGHGRVVMFPKLRHRIGPPHPYTGYVFAYPLGGGQPWGVRANKVEIVSARRILLSEEREGVRAVHGTELVCQLRATNETIPALNVHPVAHHDRPENKAAWKEAVDAIDEWAESWHGFRRYVVGDVNKQGLEIEGLRSCWEGRPDEDTFRDRTIDEVYATVRADDVKVINTPSDHHALIAYYEEP